VRDQRPYPEIPTPAITFSLFLGAVLRLPSRLQIQAETLRRGWQHLVGWPQPISDDSLGYVLERYRLEDLREVLVRTNRRLKENKQLESAKIGGLLVVALDANEQFNSRHRCCAQCCQRRIQIVDEAGNKRELIQYYHRQVYAHISGPQFSVILDLEPIAPGQDEAAAALRLLGRMRRMYGLRFFDALTVDAWYTQGPFLRAVQKLGWGVVTVLKQERLEIYQEASALIKSQVPTRFEKERRKVQLWEVNHLSFSETVGPIRVVVAEESWPQAHRIGGQRVVEEKKSYWRWGTTQELSSCSGEQIWEMGHRRWAVENHVFNELTQYYHLEHCPHHEPVAIVAWLLILVLGMNLFEIFARVHGKLLRLGKATLQEITKQLDRGIERWEQLEPLWSG